MHKNTNGGQWECGEEKTELYKFSAGAHFGIKTTKDGKSVEDGSAICFYCNL